VKHYIIRGGVEGKKRLELLGRAMWPTTARALERARLSRGMTCLDLGCGGGDVTYELAKIAGPDGRVTGVDFDEVKIGLARQGASERGLPNAEFRPLDVLTWDEDSRYDFIYCRFLLTHLKNPADALRRILRALRPGGSALVEDIDFIGSVNYPPSAAMDAYVRLYRAAAARRGCDADIGHKLYAMLREAGFDPVEFEIVQPAFASGESKQLAVLTLVNIADAVIAEGLATRGELDASIEELGRYTADDRTIISAPRVFQVLGRRPR
jgi:ubiquinone/menaquinone biosynthesis C-methylase UbiE